MVSTAAESAVRDYLTALKDPNSLRDEQRIAQLEKELSESDDRISRVMLRQQLLDARNPGAHTYEDAFATHGKAWADSHGISAAAFLAEGVPASVLRRAGFSVSDGGRDQGKRRKQGARSGVSAEQVRASLPTGEFTAKQVQQATGASAGMVRRVLQQEVEAGNVATAGTDPQHQGPGRAPVLYRR